CTGNGANCPNDGFQPSSFVCRASTGGCDPAEFCSGNGVSCPSDTASCPMGQYCAGANCQPKQANGSSCSSDAQCNSGFCVDGVCCNTACNGACDACNLTGNVGTCSFSPATTVCRASAGPCDAIETCSGTSAACPADAFLPQTTVCRASAGVCDVAEQCTGT